MKEIDNTFAFLDDFCLQQRHQLTRRYFGMRAIPDSGFNDPKCRSAYSTIQYVPEQERYLMWFNVVHVFTDLETQGEHCFLALAESRDGIHYTPAKGSIDTFPGVQNAVFAGFKSSIHGATVLYDERETNPARRFKCAAAFDEPETPMAFSPCYIAFSPDGSHWNVEGEQFRFHPYWSDTYNSLIWNPVLQQYQVFCRATGTDRRIATMTSPDLINWSKPRVILHPDGDDAPGTEFYAMGVFYSRGIFYGYLWHFITDDEDSIPYKMHGRNVCELVYSYDGLSWNRTRHLPLSLADYSGDGYGTFCQYIYNTIPSREGDSWLTVATLSRTGHDDEIRPPQGTNHLYYPKAGEVNNTRRVICQMKPGRFCGLESTGNSGRLRTKNFLLAPNGKLPSINAACPYGEIRFQLSDSTNKPVPGFSFDECIPFRGDTHEWTPQWQKRSLEECRGKIINLQIEIYNGCIFGISGAMLPFHSALPQYGYGDVDTAALDVWGTMGKKPDYDSLEMH